MTEQLTLFGQSVYGIEIDADIDLIWTKQFPTNLIMINKNSPGIFKVSQKDGHSIGWFCLTDVIVTRTPEHFQDKYDVKPLRVVQDFIPGVDHYIDISWNDIDNQGGYGFAAATVEEAVADVNQLLLRKSRITF